MCNDKSFIQAMGGPSKVAKTFGFSVQRVSNWGARGIPAEVILDHPAFAAELYKAGYKRREKAAA